MNFLLTKCLQLIFIIIKYQLLLTDKMFVAATISTIVLDERRSLIASCHIFFGDMNYFGFSSRPDTYQQNKQSKTGTSLNNKNDIYDCGKGTDDGVTSETNVHDTTSIKIFIQSTSSHFTNFYQIKGIEAVSGDTRIIPCKLISNEIRFENPSSENQQRKAVILKNVHTEKNRNFICRMNSKENMTEYFMFQILLTERLITVNNPKIEQGRPYFVVLGGELYLKCKAFVGYNRDYSLQWTTPKKNSQASISNINSNFLLQTLIIKNVTTEDEGNYTCTSSTSKKSKSVTQFIKIHDPNSNFVTLKPTYNNSDYNIASHSSVIWIANYTGYPNPKIKWLDPQNRTIVNVTNKYIVRTTLLKAILEIYDLRMADMGVYTIEANSGANKEPEIKRLTYNLSVWIKPHLMNPLKIKHYYEPNKEAEPICVWEGYPPPSINCSFREYSHNLSEYKAPKHLKPPTFDINRVEYNSTVMIKIETSGLLLCDARNKHGNDSFQHLILVSDVPNGFGIMEVPESITVDDNVELTCRASIFNFTDSIEWILLDSETRTMILNEEFIVTKNRTSFSYESILRINGINKSHENIIFVCKVLTNKDQIRETEKRLVVNDSVEPYITDTNMYGTESIYDSTNTYMPIKLKCFANGIPRPVVSWFRGNESLNATNNSYIFSNENHELVINNPNVNDNGEYICRVTNRLRTIEKRQRITIRSKEISIVLITSIIIFSMLCVILVIYFSIKIHREKIMNKRLMAAGLMHFQRGALEYLNPKLTVDDQADLLPYNKKWEFPRERLKFDRQIGCGTFGVVMKAQAERICKNELSTTVAIKMVRHSAESAHMRALVNELKIMVHLGELLVIVEYCQYGNLHNYLLRHRSNFINQIDQTTRKIDLSIGRELLTKPISIKVGNSDSIHIDSKPEMVSYTSNSDYQDSMSTDGIILNNNSIQLGCQLSYNGDFKDQKMKPIFTQDLLSWAFQIARGMEYLSQRKILHGDLAARNILLAESNVVKICDFGLARTMYKDENYKKQGEALLPIKWMAIESIRDQVFSTQSDVWSFGIVLWEFFALAETPYAGMGAKKQYQKLIDGYRMESPKFATDDIYDIMLKCWEAKPSERPTFTDLVQNIGDLLNENVKTYYVDLNIPYVDMNTKIFKNKENDYLTMMSSPDYGKLSSYTEREYVKLPNIPIKSDSAYSLKCVTSRNSEDETQDLSLYDVLTGTLLNSPVAQPKYSDKCHSKKVIAESSSVVKNEDNYYLKPINIQERRTAFI